MHVYAEGRGSSPAAGRGWHPASAGLGGWVASASRLAPRTAACRHRAYHAERHPCLKQFSPVVAQDCDDIRRQRKSALAVFGLRLLEPEAGPGLLERPLDAERCSLEVNV